jgi:hypothetical protein
MQHASGRGFGHFLPINPSSALNGIKAAQSRILGVTTVCILMVSEGVLLFCVDPASSAPMPSPIDENCRFPRSSPIWFPFFPTGTTKSWWGVSVLYVKISRTWTRGTKDNCSSQKLAFLPGDGIKIFLRITLRALLRTTGHLLDDGDASTSGQPSPARRSSCFGIPAGLEIINILSAAASNTIFSPSPAPIVISL